MEERPPIWKVAANILISSCEQPTRAGPPAWGLGEVLTVPCRKNVYAMNCSQRKPQTWTNTLVQSKQGSNVGRGC
jgi:hypothetical protein